MRGARALLFALLAIGLAACAGLLGYDRRSPEHPFEHRAHVTKGINCKECHGGVTQAGNATLHLPRVEDCVRCHQKPHDARACGLCHGEASAREGAELAREHLRFEHAKHLSYTHGECVRCHTEVAEEQPETLRPKMAICFSCHTHEKEWTTRDCDGCHVDLPAEHVLPSDHVVHEGDWIREHGTRAASQRDLCSTCHSERSCAACHGVGSVPALPARMEFDTVRLAGLHRAGFRARHADEARADPGLCSTCHSESSCQECHLRENVAPGTATRSPHPPGWLTNARGGGAHGTQARIDPMSCAGCHGGAGEQLCVGCHRVGGTGGNPHGPGFDSKLDKVRDLPCRLCHAAGP